MSDGHNGNTVLLIIDIIHTKLFNVLSESCNSHQDTRGAAESFTPSSVCQMSTARC